jgi:hypothetical protein
MGASPSVALSNSSAVPPVLFDAILKCCAIDAMCGMGLNNVINGGVVMRPSVLIVAVAILSLAPGAVAKDKDENASPPPVFQAVLDCKTIADSTERLACYDRTVGTMATASDNRDLVVADRSTMKEARRGLFGLGLPKLKLFGGGESEDVTEIESTIAGFRSASDGLLIVTLADGARWKQTDGKAQYPKAGDKVRIRKAALGSFIANINDKVGFKVIRLTN